MIEWPSLTICQSRHSNKGDVATLVDYVPHPTDGERACILEIFNALGNSPAVVAVRESAVEALRADEIMAVRPLAKAV